MSGATSGGRTPDLRFTKTSLNLAESERLPTDKPAGGLSLCSTVSGVPAAVKFYHGGPPGLRVGDRILPPSVTGVPSCKSFGAAAGLDTSVIRTDRVYLTSHPVAARMFAGMHPSYRGCVYQVTPEGQVDPDPDCKDPGLSWEAPSAVVVAVMRLSQTALRRIRNQLGIKEPA